MWRHANILRQIPVSFWIWHTGQIIVILPHGGQWCHRFVSHVLLVYQLELCLDVGTINYRNIPIVIIYLSLEFLPWYGTFITDQLHSFLNVVRRPHSGQPISTFRSSPCRSWPVQSWTSAYAPKWIRSARRSNQCQRVNSWSLHNWWAMMSAFCQSRSLGLSSRALLGRWYNKLP